jgi:hypothetical protein
MVGAASWRRRLSEDVRSGRRVGREGVGDDSELCSCQLMVLHPGSCRSLLSGPRRVYCSLVDSIAVMESDVGGCLQRRITCLLQRAPSPITRGLAYSAYVQSMRARHVHVAACKVELAPPQPRSTRRCSPRRSCATPKRQLCEGFTLHHNAPQCATPPSPLHRYQTLREAKLYETVDPDM